MGSDSCTRETNEEIFRSLYASHASEVYQRLYNACMDKQLARDILKEVFKYAYDSMQHLDTPDDAEQWLNQLADEGLRKRQRAEAMNQTVQPPISSPECVREIAIGQEDPTEDAQRAIAYVRERGLREHSAPVKHEKGYAALASLLTILLIISIWYVAGLLMQIGMIPHIDLGYTWFSTNVFSLY